MAVACLIAILGGALLMAIQDGVNKLADKTHRATAQRKNEAEQATDSGGHQPNRATTMGTGTDFWLQYPLSNMRFLDWANGTWENNVRDAFQVDVLPHGYRFQCNFSDGYEQRLIAFPKEDPRVRRLVATFEVKSGECEFSIRPANLAPRGARVAKEFQPSGTCRVELGIRNREAVATLNGQPIEVSQDSEGNGIFAIVVSRKCDVVFEELFFVDAD
jgi:hypothetical protein